MITRDATPAEEELFNALTNHLLWADEDWAAANRGRSLDQRIHEIAGVEIDWEWTTGFSTIKTKTWVAILGMGTSGLTRAVKRTITYKDADRLSVDLVALKLALL